MPKPGVAIVCCAKRIVLDAATVRPSSPLPTTWTSRAEKCAVVGSLEADDSAGLTGGHGAGEDRYAVIGPYPADIEGDRPLVSLARDGHRNQRRAATGNGELLFIESELEIVLDRPDDQTIGEADSAAVHQVFDHEPDLILP